MGSPRPMNPSSNNKHATLNTNYSHVPKNRRLMLYLFLICVFGGLVYFWSDFSLGSGLKPPAMQQSIVPYQQKVTIVMNTFERHDDMEEAVDYYSTCGLVGYIYIVWSEKIAPPDKYVKKYAAQIQPKVIFSIQSEDSLNTRFKPLPGPHTDSIFTVDDDMRVSCQDLGIAYEVWLNSPRTIVGYMPRIHLRKDDESYSYRCWWRVWWHGSYSIILTKAAFLHHDYLHQYTSIMPQSVRDLVDKTWNCEDIAMQFLVANTTNLPPIFVRGNLGDRGVLNGISMHDKIWNTNVIKAKHMGDRSACLNDLVKIYGRNPLINSHIIVSGASNGWVNRPSTWYEYISSDLWSFS